MRTNEEIVDRIKERRKVDYFGFEIKDLIIRLPFELAKEFLKSDAKEEGWEVIPKDRESVLKKMLNYMPFAWKKANNCRGLSASRTMSHYSAWTWLLGDDFGDLLDYTHYGKFNLIKICKYYGWDYKQWDNGVRTNDE